MPPKRSKKVSTQRGKGVVSDLAKKALRLAHNQAKKHKLISRGLSMTPLAPLAPVASMLGYGKKKRRTRKRGSTRASTLPGLSKKRVRRTSRAIVVPRVILPAAVGRRSRTKRIHPSQVGNGLFSDLGGGIGSVFGGLGSGIGSVAKGLFGRGQKGGRTRRAVVM